MERKAQLAAYLASLATILDQMDKSGSVNRSASLGEEYHRVYDELKGIIDKENEDEARPSDDK